MNIKDEGINNKIKFSTSLEFTKENAMREMDYVVKKVREILPEFTDKFPSYATEKLIYPKTENNTWVTGFWTGILWLCFEYTNDDTFKKVAMAQCESFRERLEKRVGVGNHDLGFMYSPSCVMGYKITGDVRLKETAIFAADVLCERFCEVGEFIQAWGELGNSEHYRLIIDCMNNIPLLFWATEVTENPKYRDIAIKHAHTSLKTVVREDATTFHTFYLDNKTGEPLRGVTDQGYSDDSIWARGQAWGVAGFPISYRYTGEEVFLDTAIKLTNVFLNRLPEDFVPFWDLIFNDGSSEERDSSSAAIAACGLIETLKTYDGEYKEIYKNALNSMMHSLAWGYTSRNEKADGILLHGVYGKPHGRGIDECNIWGDYYWAEALMNTINPKRELCW